MNAPTLMTMEEPSDEDLSWLMKGVAKEAKEKSLKADARLEEQIDKEIKEATIWFNYKYKNG
jgi:hypothetical protein